jgi:hypothetical protein
MRGLSKALTYSNGHQGSSPGGHSFVFLDISINEKPLFFSEVVTYRKAFDSIGRQHFKECYELNNSAAFAFPSF